MKEITYDGINGCVTLYFLFKLIYQNSTNTFVEKDDLQSIFYFSQFSEIFYAINGITAYQISKLPSSQQFWIIYYQYINYMNNLLLLTILQVSLQTYFPFSFLQMIGFQNFQSFPNEQFALTAIVCQQMFGQVVILLFASIFKQFRQLQTALIVSGIFFMLRMLFVVQIFHDKVVYTQYLFTAQPFQELIAFFQAYHFCYWFSRQKNWYYQGILDIVCFLMLLLLNYILGVTEKAAISVMGKSMFQILVSFLIGRFLYISYVIILILLLDKTFILKKLFSIPLFSTHLGKHQISVFCAFLISQHIFYLLLKNIQIGPLDQFLINIIIFGMSLYTILLSYIFSQVSNQILQLWRHVVDNTLIIVIQFAIKNYQKYFGTNQFSVR